jgi:hypothetical protein
MKSFLDRGMAISPDRRFEGAAEMLSAFEKALSNRTMTAVGLNLRDGGSSGERPATPPSPQPPQAGVAPDPTRRMGDVNDASSASGSVEPSDVDPIDAMEEVADAGQVQSTLEPAVRRRTRAWEWFAGPAAALAVVFGIYLAVDGAGAGVPATGPSESASTTTSPEPVPAPEPVREPVAAPAPVPATEPVHPPPPPPEFEVRFESEPEGTQVFDGDRLLGTTPFDARIPGPSGRRSYTFRKDGFHAKTVDIDVRAGSVVKASLDRRAAAAAPVPPRLKPPAKKPPRSDYRLID